MKTTYRGLRLDRFQREAIEAIDRDQDVVVAAPTGAGKTLIASYAIERALETGKRAIYTAPIKALSNQKYRDLSAAHPDQVGISTGDVSINASAPVVIMTTEIFRNTIFDDPARTAEIGWVIFDEVHYLDDPDRGTVWEESLIFAPPGVRVLALSATVSNLEELTSWMREVRKTEVKVVLETRRPVPLSVYAASTEGGIRPLEQLRSLEIGRRQARSRMRKRTRDLRGYYESAQRQLVEAVASREHLPLLFFLFSRDACGRLARACAMRDYTASPEASKAAEAEFVTLARAFELDLLDPEVNGFRRLVSHGVAYHHAGILPALKEVIERLFTDGHIRVLCATETFALGVNMPARSVAFEGIMRWNGRMRVPLKTREFQQMAGRAGRRGIDEEGAVYLTYDPLKNDRRLVTGIVHGEVEPVESQFNLSYGTLLNLYDRLGDDHLFEACERSFANYRARQQVSRGGERARRRRGKKGARHPLRDSSVYELAVEKKGRVARRSKRRRERPPELSASSPRYQDVVAQVRIKLGVLQELGYIDADGAIAERGRFAMQVFGHELELTELVWSGALKGLTPGQVAVLAAAVVFESRPKVTYGGNDPRKLVGKKAYRLASKTIDDLVELEELRGVNHPCKLLDWSLSGVVSAWVDGCEFAELREYSDASDGDVVRALRQTIQALRLALKPLKALEQPELIASVREAMRLLKRDLVDAEWQLRRAAELADLEDQDGEEAHAVESEAQETPEASEPDEPMEPKDSFSDGIW